ncbi:hypothetical protein BdWA1_001099 [Babesia duncani]|uniref:Uncharacterized protein n=1 Tax=Babesia duncani TaxID=323732 RepID=A0AAD9PNN5_9APIC|nr:hypothetical protein BdWA1_001099 [Babesia duncani]
MGHLHRIKRLEYISSLYKSYILDSFGITRKTPLDKGHACTVFHEHSRLCGKVSRLIDEHINYGQDDSGFTNSYNGLAYILLKNWSLMHQRFKVLLLYKTAKTLGVMHASGYASLLSTSGALGIFLRDFMRFLTCGNRKDFAALNMLVPTEHFGDICRSVAPILARVDGKRDNNKTLDDLYRACNHTSDLVKIMAIIYWLHMSYFPPIDPQTPLGIFKRYQDLPHGNDACKLKDSITMLYYMHFVNHTNAHNELVSALYARVLELTTNSSCNPSPMDVRQLTRILNDHKNEEPHAFARLELIRYLERAQLGWTAS